MIDRNTPLAHIRLCTYCSAQLDSRGLTTYRRVHGWAKVRRKGGINSVTLADERDIYACAECIDKLKHGLSLGQRSLFQMGDDE